MPKQPLDKLSIRGFKSIRALDNFELNSGLNVLIGANGSGKSNFIAIFRLLNAIFESHLQIYVAQSTLGNLLYYGPKVTPEIRLEVEFGANNYSAELTLNDVGQLIFASESFGTGHELTKGVPLSGGIGSGHSETMLAKTYSGRPSNGLNAILEIISDWKIYHFHDTSRSAPLKQTGDIHNNAHLSADAGNLAAFLYTLQNSPYRPYYDRIVDTIRLIAPFFDGFELRPEVANPDLIRLRWRDKRAAESFDVSALSDGTLRFMCLATLLMQPEAMLPSTILIDEPELGLHPSAINVLAGMLGSTATQNQIIISTQSVQLIDEFAPEDVIVVEREADESVFKHLAVAELADWLEDYSLGQLWQKNVLGGRP